MLAEAIKENSIKEFILSNPDFPPILFKYTTRLELWKNIINKYQTQNKKINLLQINITIGDKEYTFFYLCTHIQKTTITQNLCESFP